MRRQLRLTSIMRVRLEPGTDSWRARQEGCRVATDAQEACICGQRGPVVCGATANASCCYLLCSDMVK